MRGHTLDTGSGWPSADSVSGASKVSDSIRCALLTPKGTRPNLPRFGSRLHLLKYELVNRYTIDLIHFCIQEAIRDSLDGVSIIGIDYDISHDYRAVSISVSFNELSSGLRGRSNVAFAKGEFK